MHPSANGPINNVTMAVVTIKVETDDISEVSLIIRDALGEFINRRANGLSKESAKTYVETRYPSTKRYDWLDRDAKIEEVLRRCTIAANMLLDFTVTKDSHPITEPV